MRRFAETLSIFSAPVLWLFFYVPMDLVAANVGEVGSPVVLVSGAALAVSLAILVATTIVVAPLPRGLHLAAGALVVTAFAGAFLHLCLPVGTAQRLDGTGLRFTASPVLRHGSLAATGMLAIGIVLFRQRVVPALRVPFAIASLFLVAVPALRLGSHRADFYEIPGATIADLAQFSPQTNVLVLLLEELRREVAAPSPRSFVAEAAGAGWQTDVVTPVPHLCPGAVGRCTSLDALPVYLSDRVVASYLLFVDLTLLRTLPYSLREEHYAEGRWTAQRLLAPEIPRITSLRHNDFLRRFAAAFSLDAARPTLKLVHVMSTHLPFDLGPDCEPAPTSRRHWRTRARDQVCCGLAAAAEVVDAVRAAGISSRTAMVIAADHGSHVGRGVEGDGHLGIDDLGLGPFELSELTPFEQLASSASPLLMLKPPGEAAGAIVRDDRPRQLSDLAATVCAWTDACADGFGEGRSLIEIAPRDRRRRYAHSPIGFGIEKGAAPVWIFEVSGPIDRERSWRVVERGTVDYVEIQDAP